MIRLVNQVEVPFNAEQAWECFRRMDEHYHEWVPEHLGWRWIRGEPLAEGTTWHADEWVGPMRIDALFRVSEVGPGRRFAYRILGFPAGLVRSGGSFECAPLSSGHCELRHEVHVGFRFPLLGSILDAAIRVVVPVDELRRHMREEGDAFAELVQRASHAT